ncbi:MAG: hypothetical protein MMC33_005552 [Icmadophila ericetorum]|nr:hypothetical protein [Icmadophila ericetorum]
MHRFHSLAAGAVAFLACSCEASTLTPPVLPLFVRNPYLSTWLQNARDAPWEKWPMFWTGQEIGFSVLAAVSATDKVYPLLGRPHDSLLPADADAGYDVSFPLYQGAKYDASTTNLTYLLPAPASNDSLKPLEITLSFLSPITPTSTFRQAIPAAYLTVYVAGEFDVDIYIDVNGQWVSGDRSNKVVWELHEPKLGSNEAGIKTWKVKRQTEQILTEWNDRAEWGTLHFTGPSDVYHEAGTSAKLRQYFSKAGSLRNKLDDKFRGIMDDEPVFAFSKSFKLNGSTTSTDSVLFTMAHVQDPVVQYASARGLTFMKPLWRSWHASDEALVTFHYLDFANAAKLATAYSTQLAIDAYESGAEDYVDIVALSARQVMGATSFAGTPANPILFLKEISSNGNFQTVDVIFPAFPFFLYTNPRWLAYLLEPLLEHMESGQYPNQYTMHDLGAHFPNATGHPDGRDEYMPVEECGNILIMGLAIVNSLSYKTSDEAGSVWSSMGSDFFDENPYVSPFALTQLGVHDDIFGVDDRWGGSEKGLKQAQKWIGNRYRLWKQWTGYLEKFTLEPQNQLSTDDFAGWLALQTNLALKGILGIKAMSEIALVVGNTGDAEFFKNMSDVYISKWEEFAISRDGTHAKLAYDWYGSWTTIYNIFADALLCFHLDGSSSSESLPSFATSNIGGQKPLKPDHNVTKKGFVPQHIYTMQSDWYHAVRQKYGLPLDSRHLYTKTDWEFFAAAVMSKDTRSGILESVALWVNETETDRPFTDLHNTEGRGGFPGPNFFARPVIGGHFAFLALERACGGKAMDGLTFLNKRTGERKKLDVESLMFEEKMTARREGKIREI